MKPILKSQQLQQEFEENGFIRVPFLSELQVDNLLEQYNTIEEQHRLIGIPFITTSHSNNHELIRKADEFIVAFFKPEMDKILLDYKILFGNFLIKQPGIESATPLHQDTSFVDEKKYSSISIWVSLQNTDKTNGCMRFVKGSHKFRYTVRPTHAYPWHFEDVKQKLEKLLVDYPSKKGEAFIFHHAVIHASYPNNTRIPRIAALMAAYPTEAELMMYFQQPDNPEMMQRYKMDKEAFLHFVKGQPPKMGKLIGTEKSNFSKVTNAELDIMINSNSWIQKFTNHLPVWIKSNLK